MRSVDPYGISVAATAALPFRLPTRPPGSACRALPTAYDRCLCPARIRNTQHQQVYRGSWNGTTVAVKVIETTEPLDEMEEAAPGGWMLVEGG